MARANIIKAPIILSPFCSFYCLSTGRVHRLKCRLLFPSSFFVAGAKIGKNTGSIRFRQTICLCVWLCSRCPEMAIPREALHKQNFACPSVVWQILWFPVKLRGKSLRGWKLKTKFSIQYSLSAVHNMWKFSNFVDAGWSALHTDESVFTESFIENVVVFKGRKDNGRHSFIHLDYAAGVVPPSGSSYLTECGVLDVICLLPGSTTTFYRAGEIDSTLEPKYNQHLIDYQIV